MNPSDDDRPDAIHGVQKIPRLDAATGRRRKREITRIFEHTLERRSGRQLPRPLVPPAQLRQGIGDTARARIVRLELGKEAEMTLSLTECKEVAIAQADERAAQHPHERHRILRVRERQEEERELTHLLGVAERPGAGHLDGHAKRLERVRAGTQPFLASRQNQKVAISAAAGGHLATDVSRDPIRFPRRHTRALDGGRNVDHGEMRTGSRLPIRIGHERTEGRRLRGRCFRKAPLEDIVRPLAQAGRGSEVRRQADEVFPVRTADTLAHLVVDVDVGAAKPVDGLFGVADNEQSAAPKRHAAPVRWRLEAWGSGPGLLPLRAGT